MHPYAIEALNVLLMIAAGITLYCLWAKYGYDYRPLDEPSSENWIHKKRTWVIFYFVACAIISLALSSLNDLLSWSYLLVSGVIYSLVILFVGVGVGLYKAACNWDGH